MPMIWPWPVGASRSPDGSYGCSVRQVLEALVAKGEGHSSRDPAISSPSNGRRPAARWSSHLSSGRLRLGLPLARPTRPGSRLEPAAVFIESASNSSWRHQRTPNTPIQWAAEGRTAGTALVDVPLDDCFPVRTLAVFDHWPFVGEFDFAHDGGRHCHCNPRRRSHLLLEISVIGIARTQTPRRWDKLERHPANALRRYLREHSHPEIFPFGARASDQVPGCALAGSASGWPRRRRNVLGRVPAELRFSSMAMLPRWQRVAVRWPISTGSIGRGAT